MSESLSAPRVLLLAVHLATKSNVDGLAALAAQHPAVLHSELLLRIILTCLPETLPSSHYVALIQHIQDGSLPEFFQGRTVDSSSVQDITDADATKKVRKLKLRPLAWDRAPDGARSDPFALFLLHRAHRVDDEAGLLTQLPDLLVPFLDHDPCVHTWMVSTLLPLLRRNYEYYPDEPIHLTLSAFENLDDRAAASLLLSQTGLSGQDLAHVGRDLRGLVGPWLHDKTRWTQEDGASEASGDPEESIAGKHCPGWEQVLDWLTTQACRSWRIAVKAIDQWDGPGDVDLGPYGSTWLDDEEQSYLERRYARAILASAYLIPEASLDALSDINKIISKVMSLLDQDACPTLGVASSLLPPFLDDTGLLCPQNATYMRNHELSESNPLTTPGETQTRLLHTLTLSAYILTKAGAPCSIRRAGELAFLQDEREQKAEAIRFISSLGSNGPKNDDKYWIRARNELLWLRDWGAEEASDTPSPQPGGVFGQLKKDFLEVECLKAFLAHSRYSLARSIYEEAPSKPLDDKLLHDTIIASAMNAYDNATNPNRSRGGLLKCDDIIHAFPMSLGDSSPAARKIEALLKATHTLNGYRLALKQGEPFMPAVLRAHSDPVSLIGKVLEQNPRSYTKMQDFLEIGANIVGANLIPKHQKHALSDDDIPQQRLVVERRIIAMCVDAALTEDDFETAYSYVVNRLAMASGPPPSTTKSPGPAFLVDDYSWKAALQAGKYRRTAQTVRPTHIGTASGNPDIRHLEQRIECLSTALRVGPVAALQEMLNAFRKCEEELHAAVRAEEDQEAAWDAQADGPGSTDTLQAMPGAFSSTVPAGVKRGGNGRGGSSADSEAPMSLFDLSRAVSAKAHIPALSSLRHTKEAVAAGDESSIDEQNRVRKRDQFRDVAVGTLASGVGWLIGAPAPAAGSGQDSD